MIERVLGVILYSQKTISRCVYGQDGNGVDKYCSILLLQYRSRLQLSPSPGNMPETLNAFSYAFKLQAMPIHYHAIISLSIVPPTSKVDRHISLYASISLCVLHSNPLPHSKNTTYYDPNPDPAATNKPAHTPLGTSSTTSSSREHRG